MKTLLTHHHLRAELLDDQNGPCIKLTQQGDYSEPSEVLMHPGQLRAVCEHFGLPTADQRAEKAITTLQRRMLALQRHIDDLGHYMANFSDHKHADLSHELNSVTLLAELASEWCADFQEPQTQVAATEAGPTPAPAATPAHPVRAGAGQATLL